MFVCCRFQGDGATPLLVASQNGHEDVVRLLLQESSVEVDRAQVCEPDSEPVVVLCVGGQAGMYHSGR